MSRTNGAKDRRPRNHSPASIAARFPSRPGWKSVSIRIHAPAPVIARFIALTPMERGEVISG